MNIKYLLGFAVVFFWNLGCKHPMDPEPVTPQEQDFTCIKLFDELGQDMGIHGSCSSSDDWGQITLNKSEKALLDFSDTVSLAGTVSQGITLFSIAPCPVKIEQALQIYFVGDSSNPNVKFKMVIVDELLHVVKQVAVKVQNSHVLALYMDPALFQSGKYYRMYYRFSANGAPSLFEGHGNFLVCKTYIDGVNTTIESDCP